MVELVLWRKPVARLHLERRDTSGEDPAVGGLKRLHELAVRGLARCLHCGPDATAFARHLFQRGAGKAPGVLGMTGPRKQGMRVALDQARHDGLTGPIERGDGIAPLLQDLICGTDCGDAPVANRHRAVGDQVEPPCSVPRRASPRLVTRAS